MKPLRKLATHFYKVGRKDPLLLVAVILCYYLFWAFGEVVEEVLEGDNHQIDETILLWFRTPGNTADPIGPLWLEEAMRDITGLGGVAILTMITVFSVIYLLIRARKLQALYLLGAVVTGVILSNLAKVGFNQPRPELVPHGSYTVLPGFPSGHSLISAVVYLTIAALIAESHRQKRLRFFFLGLAVVVVFMIGVSRVYLGVHWPSDVLAGWLVGAGWALLFWIVARYLRLHHKGFARDSEKAGPSS